MSDNTFSSSPLDSYVKLTDLREGKDGGGGWSSGCCVSFCADAINLRASVNDEFVMVGESSKVRNKL